jgi:serine/threonine protein kinase
MERYCERCERVTIDGNLWCQEVDCPAEEGIPVFSYGDFLGDLKVIKLLRVWRTAALYEAERGDKKVLLKVAHSSEACEERLKRETTLLSALTGKAEFPISIVRSFLPHKRSLVPVVLPPYPMPSKRPYGEITSHGEPKIYAVYEHAEGKFLSDLLLESPQIWHYEAAWLIMALADALHPLIARNRTNLGLHPDVVLVDTDNEGHLRPLLLDLGWIVDGNELASIGDWSKLAEPGYTAPELLTASGAQAASPAADVYSLGLMLHELLAGKPALDSKLLRDDQIRDAAMQMRGAPTLDRPELQAAGVVKIVERAVAPANRYKTAKELANALAAVYGRQPTEKRPVPRRTYLLVGTLGILLLVTVASAIYTLVRALGG